MVKNLKKYYKLIQMTDFNRSSPINIPKKYTKSKYSFNAPPSDSSNFYYELEILFENNKKKMFRKILDKKYADLIELHDKIKYSDLKSFKIEITKIPNRDNRSYIMKDKINKNLNHFSKKNDDIYIEFSKNNIGYTMCTCYYAGIDFTETFISPPN